MGYKIGDMRNDEILEIIQAVDNINDSLDKQLGDMNNIRVEYIHRGYSVSSILFMHQLIWNDADDGREWIEEIIEDHPDGERYRVVPAHHEPMEPYLRKRIMEVLKSLKKVKL